MAQPAGNLQRALGDRFQVAGDRFPVAGDRFLVSAHTAPIVACELAWSALLRWQAEHPGSGDALAVFATRQATHDNEWMAVASQSCRYATFRTRGTVRPNGGPVLLFFPTQQVLDDYDRDDATAALFVVESAESPLTAWRTAYEPAELG